MIENQFWKCSHPWLWFLPFALLLTSLAGEKEFQINRRRPYHSIPYQTIAYHCMLLHTIAYHVWCDCGIPANANNWDQPKSVDIHVHLRPLDSPGTAGGRAGDFHRRGHVLNSTLPDCCLCLFWSKKTCIPQKNKSNPYLVSRSSSEDISSMFSSMGKGLERAVHQNIHNLNEIFDIFMVVYNITCRTDEVPHNQSPQPKIIWEWDIAVYNVHNCA